MPPNRPCPDDGRARCIRQRRGSRSTCAVPSPPMSGSGHGLRYLLLCIAFHVRFSNPVCTSLIPLRSRGPLLRRVKPAVRGRELEGRKAWLNSRFGDNARIGAVKKRSQLATKLRCYRWTLRNKEGGKYGGEKAGGEKERCKEVQRRPSRALDDHPFMKNI
jgi:hypothetical protein